MPSSEAMIEVHSLTAVLGAELLVVLVLILLFLLWRGSSRTRKDQAKANDLVTRINAEHTRRLENLGSRIFETIADFPAEKREQSMSAVALKENELYRHVIRAFLNHDMDKLAELDRYVHGLSEPYCQLIADLIDHLPKGNAQQKAEQGLEERLSVAEAVAQESQAKAEQINHQLTLALSTLDEVSSEYTKMFNEARSAEELNHSRKRMLEAFRRTEHLASQGILPELHTPEPE
jgi:hypothetical protein